MLILPQDGTAALCPRFDVGAFLKHVPAAVANGQTLGVTPAIQPSAVALAPAGPQAGLDLGRENGSFATCFGVVLTAVAVVHTLVVTPALSRRATALVQARTIFGDRVHIFRDLARLQEVGAAGVGVDASSFTGAQLEAIHGDEGAALASAGSDGRSNLLRRLHHSDDAGVQVAHVDKVSAAVSRKQAVAVTVTHGATVVVSHSGGAVVFARVVGLGKVGNFCGHWDDRRFRS